MGIETTLGDEQAWKKEAVKRANNALESFLRNHLNHAEQVKTPHSAENDTLIKHAAVRLYELSMPSDALLLSSVFKDHQETLGSLSPQDQDQARRITYESIRDTNPITFERIQHALMDYLNDQPDRQQQFVNFSLVLDRTIPSSPRSLLSAIGMILDRKNAPLFSFTNKAGQLVDRVIDTENISPESKNEAIKRLVDVAQQILSSRL